MLAHILYGTSSLAHGGLRFDARAAGPRGQDVKLQIVQGAAVVITATQTGVGAGTIHAQVKADTTEKQLIKALRAQVKFNNLARVEQVTGNGSAIVGTLAQMALPAPTLGLLQWLESRLKILGWDDRDFEASDKPTGLIFTFEAEPIEKSVNRNQPDLWRALVQIGVAFQMNDTPFVVQNALLDLFREHLYYSVKTFTHPHLIAAIGDYKPEGEVYGYSNKLKEQAENSRREDAQLSIVGNYQLRFEQPAFELTDLTSYEFDHFQVGLFREPVDKSVSVVGDGEVLDQVITYPPQE